MTDNNKNYVTGEITVEYIPDGFKLDESIDLGKQTIYKYHNVNGEFFTVFKNSSEAEVDFDTENFKSEELIIDSVEYIYCQGDLDMNNLIWTKNDYIYRIDGTLSKEELLKIAKTIE